MEGGSKIERTAVEPPNAVRTVAQLGGIVRFLAFLGLGRAARTRFLVEES